MGQYANELYAQNYSLQCENKALRRIVDEFKSGKRYKKLQEGTSESLRVTNRKTEDWPKHLQRKGKQPHGFGIYGLNSVIWISTGIRKNWRKRKNASVNLRQNTGKHFWNMTKSFWMLRKNI